MEGKLQKHAWGQGYGMPLKVLVTGYNYRNIGNFRPVLERLDAEGASIHSMLFPYTSDKDSLRLDELPYPRVVYRPIKSTDKKDMSYEELVQHVSHAMTEVQPDLILLDDVFNYPSHCIYAALRDSGHSHHPPVIAFQHGFCQEWDYYDRTFPCDFFFCFGEAQRRRFSPDKQSRVFSIGLPKMDSLREYTPSDQNYMLYIGQWAPEWKDLKLSFEKLVEVLGIPMVIRPHPQFHFMYKSAEKLDNFYVAEPFGDIVPLVANCSFVITPGSTSGLEAIWFGKKVVVIPAGPAWRAYDSDLFLTKDFSAAEILRILEQADRRWDEIEQFLVDNTGGRSFKSVETCLKTLDAILAGTVIA